MGAKQKLNGAYLNGCMVAAAVIGACFDSVTAFCIAAGILIVTQTLAGGIRPGA